MTGFDFHHPFHFPTAPVSKLSLDFQDLLNKAQDVDILTAFLTLPALHLPAEILSSTSRTEAVSKATDAMVGRTILFDAFRGYGVSVLPGEDMDSYCLRGPASAIRTILQLHDSDIARVETTNVLQDAAMELFQSHKWASA